MYAYLVAIAVVLSSWASTVDAAVECQAELPTGVKEYWSWRIIDGKRCWYPGRPGMSKANLRWPQSEPVPEERPAPELEDVRNFAPPKANPPNFSQPNDELSFAERWPY
jgi:hypothetical protein